MPRWVAVVGGSDPEDDLRSAGAAPVELDIPGVALGILGGERPGRGAGPWRAGDLTLVGEVTLWNPGELAAALIQPPQADAHDGEILARLLAERGPAALATVRGAFAICAAGPDGVLIARDAIGERTLFRAAAGQRLAASSSLRALRRLPWLPRRPSLAGVAAFLTFAYVPGEDTLIEGVRELRPGRYAHLTSGGHERDESFWEPAEGRVEDPGVEGFRTLLDAAVDDRLPKGRPVAVLLSGGIDSSAVTAVAARLHDAPVTTWAISFGDDLPSERGYAELVAAHCRTEHRTLTVGGSDVAARLADAMALLDDPVGDPLTVPNLLLDEAIARAGHDVLLNGEGGDPVLGGPKNLPMLVSELQPEPGEQRAAIYLRSYRKLGDQLEELLTADARAEVAQAPPLTHHVEPFLADGAPMSDLLHRLLHANLRTKGAHHILPKVDRLTSSAGVEGRSPLFDQRLVDAAFAAPARAKLAGTREKAILKDAVADLLPPTILHRPKSGMRVPVQAWLEGPLRELGRDALLGERTRARGILRSEPIRAWLDGRGSLWPRHGQQLWLALSLELWLRAYVD